MITGANAPSGFFDLTGSSDLAFGSSILPALTCFSGTSLTLPLEGVAGLAMSESLTPLVAVAGLAMSESLTPLVAVAGLAISES